MRRPLRSALTRGSLASLVTAVADEMGPFEQCYREKATPIWQSYCREEPDSRQCKR
jgi:hypothetical protein